LRLLLSRELPLLPLPLMLPRLMLTQQQAGRCVRGQAWLEQRRKIEFARMQMRCPK
jgi:hypothetical protein